MADWRTAVHYRNRAELMRTVADEIEHKDHRLALRKIAIYYDKLAADLEREARGKPT